MTKNDIIRRLKAGESIKIISPSDHKYYNIVRKAEKIQTNAVKFVGGSWLYFTDIDKEINNLGYGHKNGFTLKSLGDDTEIVVYEWVR